MSVNARAYTFLYKSDPAVSSAVKIVGSSEGVENGWF